MYLINLNSALSTWNDKLAEIWTLVSTSPENFKGGGVWSVIVNINGGLKAVGYALLVLFFVMGVVKTMGSFAELKNRSRQSNALSALPLPRLLPPMGWS